MGLSCEGREKEYSCVKMRSYTLSPTLGKSIFSENFWVTDVFKLKNLYCQSEQHFMHTGFDYTALTSFARAVYFSHSSTILIPEATTSPVSLWKGPSSR